MAKDRTDDQHMKEFCSMNDEIETFHLHYSEKLRKEGRNKLTIEEIKKLNNIYTKYGWTQKEAENFQQSLKR